MPCSVEKVKYTAPGFRFSGRIALALPLPPADPYVFATAAAAARVAANSERLGRKVRESIIRDYILVKFPKLQPFAERATFAATPHAHTTASGAKRPD